MTDGELDHPEAPNPAAPNPAAPSEVPLFGRHAASTAGSLMEVRDEWIAFYDAHFYRVVRFLMRIGASHEAAEEAAQEAFLESWALMDKAPGGWQAIEAKDAWIRTVALRRYHRPPGPHHRPLTVGGDIPDRPVASPGHDEVTAQAQMALTMLRNLDEESRTVMAFDMDDIPTAVIARQLGITGQRVRDVRKKARVALKKTLAKSMTSGDRQP